MMNLANLNFDEGMLHGYATCCIEVAWLSNHVSILKKKNMLAFLIICCILFHNLFEVKMEHFLNLAKDRCIKPKLVQKVTPEVGMK